MQKLIDTPSGAVPTSAAVSTPPLVRGLEGVIALRSKISSIDGQAGTLVYRGYDVRDLAEHVTYEEVVHLLWHGDLPDQRSLDALKNRLQDVRELPDMVVDLLARVPRDAVPMAVLRTAVSALALYDDEAEDHSHEANLRKSIRLVARVPMVIATFDRIRKGQTLASPPKDGSLAQDFLHRLNGRPPGEAAVRTFEASLTLHADHGLNASTFTARVIGSTLSDIYSAVSGGIGALKGPLHGGANQEVKRMLLEIDRSGQSPGAFVRAKMKNGQRIMGFGHRVYKTMDPRAAILKGMLEELSRGKNDWKWYDMSMEIMETMRAEKGLNPNVDFFSASVYSMLGIDVDLYTPIFVFGRTCGWTAHVLEQWEKNRLIRPRAEYAGPSSRKAAPIEGR